MSVAKTIEISAESSQGFGDAIQKGITRANETVKNVEGAWVKDQQVVVKNGKITTYRVHLKVTFLIEG